MAKTKKQKEQLLEEYKKILSDSKGLIVLKSKALNPNELSAIKKELFDFDSGFKVIKNNVFKIALKENKLNDETIDIGEHSIVFFGEDIVNPAKTIKKHIDLTKQDKEVKIEIVSAVLDGEMLNQEQAKELSEMPSKEQSISMIMGILDNAVSGVLNVLEDPVRSYVFILDQAKK